MVSGRWIAEHYEIEDAYADVPHLVCSRCRMRVEYLTKHAVLRHNDPIRILPIIPEKLGNIPLANAW